MAYDKSGLRAFCPTNPDGRKGKMLEPCWSFAAGGRQLDQGWDGLKLAEFEISELRHNLESPPKVCLWPDNSTSYLKSTPCQAGGYGCQWGGAEPL